MKTPTVMPEEIPHDVIISCPSDKNVTQQVCMRKFHQRHSMFGCLHIYGYFLESLTWKERLKHVDIFLQGWIWRAAAQEDDDEQRTGREQKGGALMSRH